MSDPVLVRDMFGRIAGRYDLLNHLLSAGVDRRWRKVTVARAGSVTGKTVVDVCCGTGDLALAFARAGARVLGVDFTPEMLDRARAKQRERSTALPLLFLQGDALALPLADSCADVAAVAFGARNLADPRKGLEQMARIVRPGGLVLVLEFAHPRQGLFGAAYQLYFHRVLPRLGRWISGDSTAYSYLPRTVSEWPEPPALESMLASAGLAACGHRLLSGGIACLHWGQRPLLR